MPPAGRTSLTRCVLWRPAHLPIPADLHASLDRKSVEIIDCSDAHTAMANLCLLEHTPREPFVLLLVLPTQLPEAAHVLDAAARYAPHAARWWYDQQESPKLRQVSEADIAAWSPSDLEPAPSIASAFTSTTHFPPAARRQPPPLRLIGDEADAPPPAEPAAPPSRNGAAGHAPAPHAPGADRPDEAPLVTPAMLLTNEELAMLLSDDPSGFVQQDPRARRPGNGGPTP